MKVINDEVVVELTMEDIACMLRENPQIKEAAHGRTMTLDPVIASDPGWDGPGYAPQYLKSIRLVMKRTHT